MPRYMLLMYQPPEGGPSPEEWAEHHEKWTRFTQDLTEAGLLVANEGLSGIDAATTVRVRDGGTQLTDGPFAETKEHFAGFFLIDAEDLDQAVTWAARIPSATYGSVEIRPVWGAG